MARPKEHGHAGPPASSEYRAWSSIKGRCFNPKDPRFEDYGGRGITVCAQWATNFLAFLADVGPRPSRAHSIDRIDNDGHYEPGNVKWSTAREQCSNRRSNRLMALNGQTKTAAEWARGAGLNPETLSARLARGWDLGRALAEPVKRKNPWTPGSQR
jgi:hypothetical protein